MSAFGFQAFSFPLMAVFRTSTDRRMDTAMRAPIFALLLLALPACTSDHAFERLTGVGINHSMSSERIGPCPEGTERDPSQPGPVRYYLDRDTAVIPVAGMWNRRFPGDDAMPCDHWEYHDVQALFAFDLSLLRDRAVVDARLTFEVRDVVDGGALPREPGCSFQVRAASEPWTDGVTSIARRPVATLPVRRSNTVFDVSRVHEGGGEVTLDVTSAVAAWVRDARDNHGFAIVPFPDQHGLRIERYCFFTPMNPTLTVTVGGR
jgi:hypothetical protein